jgi:hypothetical protein
LTNNRTFAQLKHMKHRIMVPVTDKELRDFRIQAINKGVTAPKLARERLFPDSQPVATAIPARKGAS